ncbi:MAG: GIY-YIG nuclease family protein [Promethearchaeota archaeon]|nr:MAG: GIY-YIG nuclease family protein [Candidatus Lokiarchaeota archaeon]
MRGTYLLSVALEKDAHITIGALGEIFFPPGSYIYVGSAMAQRGALTLEHRVRRHLLSPDEKSIRWHIDYFLANRETSIVSIHLIPSKIRLECLIAEGLLSNCDNSIPKFGCSDCKCESHLFYFNEYPNLETMLR